MIFRNIGLKLMTRKGKTYSPAGTDDIKSHILEKSSNSLGIYLIALSPQPSCHPPYPIKRYPGKLLISKKFYLLKIKVIIGPCAVII